METKVNGDGGLERLRPRQRPAHVDASDLAKGARRWRKQNRRFALLRIKPYLLCTNLGV